MPKIKWKNPSGTPEYYSWRSMRNRCQNIANDSYGNYGGRGILFCERWEDYDNFFADMGKRPLGTSLERKDNNGDYTPDNCKWATTEEQLNNQRRNRRITHAGETRTLSQWATHIGVRLDTLAKRLLRMPEKAALRAANIRPVPVCGERSGYESGCRCKQCKLAHNARMRDQRARRNAKLVADRLDGVAK